MKNLKAPFLAFAFILSISIVSAGSTPPPPTGRMASSSATAGSDDDPDGGPDESGQPPLPIDQNIVILFVSALALGATVIYRNQIKKASN